MYDSAYIYATYIKIYFFNNCQIGWTFLLPFFHFVFSYNILPLFVFTSFLYIYFLLCYSVSLVFSCFLFLSSLVILYPLYFFSFLLWYRQCPPLASRRSTPFGWRVHSFPSLTSQLLEAAVYVVRARLRLPAKSLPGALLLASVMHRHLPQDGWETLSGATIFKQELDRWGEFSLFLIFVEIFMPLSATSLVFHKIAIVPYVWRPRWHSG